MPNFPNTQGFCYLFFQTIFRAKFDLGAFDPEDIEVRVDNQTLSVQAKHTQRSQNSSSGQYFCRAMVLPDGVRTEELKSKLEKVTGAILNH